ncbi:aquaporin AQPAe.a-like [Danaus plexippus]|uniref:aquaporin AQPAe.a-like n=1 Tax=Danaus plexippus TaxID=13037 RepID=UPI002AB03A97|nr:aquaporin AQPAe.a-like [Danaus plexippus]
MVDHSEVDILPVGGGHGSARSKRAGEWCRVWSVSAAELCGTSLLVLLSCLPAAADPQPGLLQRSLSAGLVVALIVQCFDHVSGAHLNPTVTVAAALSGRTPLPVAAAMCASQLAGSALGAVAARLLSSRDIITVCITTPASHISVYQAVVIEMLLGCCLALANLSSWDVRNQYLIDSWPLRIGFTVSSLSLVAGDLTGASMNPVRSFAPALCSGNWTAHWVYWVGPLSGSCLAVALYAALWRDTAAAPRRTAPSSTCTYTHQQNKT